MAVSKPVNPFSPTKKSTVFDTLTSPASVGIGTAFALAVSQKFGLVPLNNVLPKSAVRLPPTALAVALGLPTGYLAAKSAEWIRWKIVQSLLGYQGWVDNPRSNKTKAWAALMKIFKWRADSTYTYQRALPKQPLPDLDQTLDIWLKEASYFLNKEDFEQTKDAVERFRQNEGPQLQTYLQERSKKTVNWLSDYWTTAAYLSSREPLSLYSNFFLCNRRPATDVSDAVTRAASCVDTFMVFYELILHNRLPPIELQGMVPLCMNGYGHIFNSVRAPGEHLDKLVRFPGETHIVVIRKGQYYRIEMYINDRKKPGQKRLLRPEEIKLQLERICADADKQAKQAPVAALTTLKRNKWAKLREKLAVDNPETLKAIESSLFIFALDDESPKDIHDHAKIAMTGRGNDRWFDKGFNGVTWPTAAFGANIEHTGIDAMVFCSVVEHVMVAEQLKDGDVVRTAEGPDPSLPQPGRLQWDLKEMESDIKQAYDEYKIQADRADVHVLNTAYGKGFIKKARLSPDGYIQMAIQLAYYYLHEETTRTYEPSTGRLYALGRTENINPVSTDSKAWVRSMTDDTSTPQTRRELLKRAVNEQTRKRLVATVGQSCDRHLLGLYCASHELGMDTPGVFTDKAWRTPFKLSTSQTPTRMYELGVEMDPKWIIGGFGPYCEEGYGVSYVPLGEDLINFKITSWHHCEATGSAKMAAAITRALEEMKALYA